MAVAMVEHLINGVLDGCGQVDAMSRLGLRHYLVQVERCSYESPDIRVTQYEPTVAKSAAEALETSLRAPWFLRLLRDEKSPRVVQIWRAPA